MRTMLAGLAMLSVAACAMPPGQPASEMTGPRTLPSYDALVRQFEATAFGSEYADGPQRTTIAKWLAPPSYATKQPSAALDRAVYQVSEALGATIVPASTAPTITVWFLDRLPGWARGGGCAVTRGTIRADIVIQRGNPRLDHCILEELYQAMGFMNDACYFRPSIVCDDDDITILAAGDRLLLRALYDPRLRPGMGPTEAMPLARQIIRELYDAATQ